MLRYASSASAAALLVSMCLPASAATPVALLIGNGDACKPHLDLVSRSLANQGWLVSRHENVSRKKVLDALHQFAVGTPPDSLALVYLVGECVDGQHRARSGEHVASKFFVPEQAQIRNVNDVRSRCIGIHELVEKLSVDAGSTRFALLLHDLSPVPRFDLGKPMSAMANSLVGFSRSKHWSKTIAAGYQSKKLAIQLAHADPSQNDVDNWVVWPKEFAIPKLQPKSRRISARSFSSPRFGDEIVNSFGQVYCWCPPGSFRMGSPNDEVGRSYDEDQVEVKLSRGFWISKYELTEREYRHISGRNQRRPAGKNFPVIDMRGGDGRSLAERLTKHEQESGVLPKHWRYSLPTEAQWEYACRAGTKTAFSFGEGNDDLYRFGNFADRQLLTSDSSDFRYADHRYDDGWARVAPVGQYVPNAWGIHDMHGNVWEWCSDPYGQDLLGGLDPKGPEKDGGRGRVMRGGGWLSRAEYCRSSMRQAQHDLNDAPYIGVRLVIVAEEKK